MLHVRKGTAAINNNQSTKDIVEKSPQQIENLLLFEYHLFGAALSYCFCFLKNLSIWIKASLAPILELPKHYYWTKIFQIVSEVKRGNSNLN